MLVEVVVHRSQGRGRGCRWAVAGLVAKGRGQGRVEVTLVQALQQQQERAEGQWPGAASCELRFHHIIRLQVQQLASMPGKTSR